MECRKRKSRSHGKRKNGNIKRKICTEKRLNTSLKDLSIALNNHGKHGLFSFLSSFTISVLRYLELEADNFMIELTNYIKQHSLQGVMFNISIVLISILRSTINDILLKFNSLTKVWSSLIYKASLRII